MREIKFRAWDDFDRRMVVNIKLGDELDYNFDIIMQYTGLKDKNGKEIYEGDICKYVIFDHNGYDTNFIGKVKNTGTEISITQIPDTTNNGDYGINLGWIANQDEEIEIIGNIYENPELLTNN